MTGVAGAAGAAGAGEAGLSPLAGFFAGSGNLSGPFWPHAAHVARTMAATRKCARIMRGL
jgi:hypothetical protein